jgi:hypothetical protein
MKFVLALAAGYVIGARTGSEHFDDVVRSLRAIKDSEEFRDLVTSVRSQASATLRELASVIERPSAPGGADPAATGDLVERVRHLAGLR